MNYYEFIMNYYEFIMNYYEFIMNLSSEYQGFYNLVYIILSIVDLKYYSNIFCM